MGAAFGGASQTLFGGSGGSTFMSKLTTGAAILFMVTCLGLTYLGGGGGTQTKSIMENVPIEKPQAPAIPEAKPVQPVPQQAAPQAKQSAPQPEKPAASQAQEPAKAAPAPAQQENAPATAPKQ